MAHPKLGMKKLVYTLDSAFKDPLWPQIPPSTERVILDLLIPLLEPIGQHRREYATPSKGKGRKREARTAQMDQNNIKFPEIHKHLTVGFNSTVRQLENISRNISGISADSKTIKQDDVRNEPMQKSNNGVDSKSIYISPCLLSTVFVCHETLPPIMTSSLPLLVTMASAAHPERPPIRIVCLSEDGTNKIAQALHQPKVALLGIESGAPDAIALETFIRSEIDVMEVPWIRQSTSAEYLPVKIHESETVPNSKSSERKRKREVQISI